MGWLRLAGSLKLQVSSAGYRLFCRALLQKRHIDFEGPTNRSHPIPTYIMAQANCVAQINTHNNIANRECVCTGIHIYTYIHMYTYICMHICIYMHIIFEKKSCTICGIYYRHTLCVAICCSVLQCVAVCCSVLQCVAACCCVLQSDAVRCSV